MYRNWENWKTEFQRLMYEADLKTEFIELLSDDYWKTYFTDMSAQGMTPKEAFNQYLEEATNEN